MSEDREVTLRDADWWTVSRPYRVTGELVIYSIICLVVLIFVLSRSMDDPQYRLIGVQPIFWVGVLAGGLGGCARGLLDFWRRTSFNLMKRDYWKHALPFYIGLVFGLLMVLVIQTTFKVFGVSNSVPDTDGLSFLAMVCMFSGMFTGRAESIFSRRFEQFGNNCSNNPDAGDG